MSGANVIAGTAFVSVDGRTVMVAGKFSYFPGRVKRETKVGMDGIHGVKETFTPPFISCEVRDAGGLVVADFNDMTNVTIVAELANGKTVMGAGMWTVDSQEVDSEEATFPVKWEGMTGSVKEM